MKVVRESGGSWTDDKADGLNVCRLACDRKADAWVS